MHEQFKLLAQQAKEESSQWTGSKPAITVTYDELEKFAELIVEECRYVMDCNKGSDQTAGWNQALFETSNKIKQHFGVEE